MRTVSFCFDDGFRATAGKVCRLFESRGVSACFAVLAAPALAQDPLIRASETADWGFWREAVAAGHAVEPHGHAHEHLGRMAFPDAVKSMERSLGRFEQEFRGFQPGDVLFHLPYLAAPPAVVDWLALRMLGVRIGSDAAGLNQPEAVGPGGRVECITFGPGLIDERFAARVERFLDNEQGWLVLVLHGLDDEGWGPLSSSALERMLDRMLEAKVVITPPSQFMRMALGR